MRRAMRAVAGSAVLLVAASTIAGAQGAPAGWVWQHDRGPTPAGAASPRDTAWTFVSMAPGWHITTGPASVLYHPALNATGNYSLSSEVFLFRNPTAEGYGLFLGGRAMGTDSASYTAVLLRRDGAVSVEAHARGATTVAAPWTSHGAIKPNPGDQIVENHLRVRVGADSLRVFVNDSSVLAIPRGSLQADGVFGFRVGRGLNLHVTTLDHTHHIAPVPQR